MATTVEQPYNLFALEKMQGQAIGAEAKPQPTEKAVEPQPTEKVVAAAVPQITSTEDLAAALARSYTSPEQEQKLRKASAMNQRILAFGDAIRHIGNIANTVNYAPSQQFNSPVAVEQARYERGKALRDRANQTYYTYLQQKAAQDAKARQWEAEQQMKADQWNATYRFNAAKTAADLAERKRQYDTTHQFNREKQKATEERWARTDAETRRSHKANEGLGAARLALARTRENNAQAYRQFKMNGGGGGGRNTPTVLHTRKGAFSKAGMTATEKNNIYDILYEWGKGKKTKRVVKGKVEEGSPYINDNQWITDSAFLGDRVTRASKEAAVNKMLQEHDDAVAELERMGFRPFTGSQVASDGMDLGLEDEDDNMDLGLE